MKSFEMKLRHIRVCLPNGRELLNIKDHTFCTGEHVLIKGPSGRGKSTLLHLLAGLFTPEEGEVLIGKTNLSTLGEDQRCDYRKENIGIIFQKLNLLDHLTVLENITLTSKVSKPLIQDILKQLHLEDRMNDRCSELSLGEQQRVATARVLAQRPSIVLADEPTSSLDEFNADALIKSLKHNFREETLIVVSHDERLAPYFDRVLNIEEISCRP